MKKAVVTGGLGFIGSHLTEQLLSQGIQVIILDNGVTGRFKNIESFSSHPNLQVVNVDIAQDPIDSHLSDAQWVFHLAGLADIVPSIQKPWEYCRANILGTIRVLEAARAMNVRKVIYAASSSCYGIPDVIPTPETAAIQPQYPYALSKRLGEESLLHWGPVYGMSVISLRLFNVYGLRSRTTGAYGAVFGVFLAQKLAGKPLTIVGNGEQKRDFVYVSDVAEAFIAAANSSIQQDVFNVGADQPISVNRLADLVGGTRLHIPRRPGEPDITHADISKIKKHLGWQPKISFEEGVQKIMSRIDDWRDAPVWTADSIAAANKDWFYYLGAKGDSQ